MAETKFTKGPWAADGEICTVSDAFLLWCGAVNPPEVDGFRGSICRIQSAAHLDGDPISNAEAEANAYLIAAAPLLYEELENAIKNLEYTEGEYGAMDADLNRFRYALSVARGEAALALAEGKQ